MKKISIITLLMGMFSCQVLNIAVQEGNSTTLTQNETASALKEALSVGVRKGVEQLMLKDGYFENEAVKIFLPPEAQKVEKIIREKIPGGQGLIDNAILKMNRAAEDAAKEALPVFSSAIKSMTINDAKNILFGSNDAATKYLEVKTMDDLKAAYQPKIRASLEKVGALKAWTSLTKPYNRIAGTVVGNALGATEKINEELDQYVTHKALEGLFYKIAEEELKIRKNPAERASNLLKKVFGKLD